MSEMVERVARAMYEMVTDSCRADNGTLTLSQTNRGSGWDSQPEEIKTVLRSNARAAIAAMREPTFDPDRVSYHQGMTRTDWWRAMINAALTDISQ